jgi:hypothetical protein
MNNKKVSRVQSIIHNASSFTEVIVAIVVVATITYPDRRTACI